MWGDISLDHIPNVDELENIEESFSSSDILRSCSTSFIGNSIPEEVFRIRNVETGEEVDIRDINKQSFIDTYTNIINADKERLTSIIHYIRIYFQAL